MVKHEHSSDDVNEYVETSAGNDVAPGDNNYGAEQSSGSGGAQMDTVLARFSERFQEHVGPVLEPIRRAADVLQKAHGSPAAERVLPQLRDSAHQLQVLNDKVAAQQAYVLIFGPLKSGKSTFMNAMCAAYVSEVTCLPAYPCMLYVSPAKPDAERSEFIVTRYDGREETFTDRDRLGVTVEQAHALLSDRIREVEQSGEAFDPATHMPSAIRRVDVKVPAGELEKSGATLVDTPGLYTRMKFGYDRMTRDFRDAAACAIFVVKTDNLFLEQVFNEFNELLELFSRIFLIVNLDSSKQDLLPNGELKPSLEHENPQRVLEAFETLAMTGPLKQAADEGRLRIIPVDLLQAASRRIRAKEAETRDATAERVEQVSEAGETEIVYAESGDETERGQTDFNHLLTELTDYLNSNEYLHAFLVDSLRRANTLTAELVQISGSDVVEDLKRETQDLRQDQALAQQQSEALGRLQNVDWDKQTEQLQQTLVHAAEDKREDVDQSARQEATQAVDAWLDSDESLHALNEQKIDPLLARTRDQFVTVVRRALASRIDARPGGLELSTSIHNDMRTAGIDLDQTARRVVDRLEIGGDEVATPASALSPGHLPIRKRFSDWIFFRRKSALARRLFGRDDEPNQSISASEKAARLGEPAKQSMHQALTSQIEELARRMVEQLPQQTAQDYAAALRSALKQQLDQKQSKAGERLKTASGRLETSDRTLATLSDLHNQAKKTRGAVTTLSAEFAPNAAIEQEDEGGIESEDFESYQEGEDESRGAQA